MASEEGSGGPLDGVPVETIATLREFWVASQAEQRELSGKLDARGRVVTELEEAVACGGTSTSTYTVAEVGAEDARFTFHTHPIEYGADGEPANYPNLVSNEDMIGAVQDSVRNHGFLSTPGGRNEYDVLVAPLGLFVYWAEEAAIELWAACEPTMEDAADVEAYIEHFVRATRGRRAQQAVRAELEGMGADELRAHCAAHPDTRNVFFAEVENAFCNDKFDAVIGSWGYFQEGKGAFAETIVPRFGTLGYASRWWRQPATGGVDSDEVQRRVASSRAEQERWFTSRAFLTWDACEDAQVGAYCDAMRELGFGIAFYPWARWARLW